MSLLEALGFLAPTSSRTSMRSWLKEGRILVDNVIMTQGTREVESGQVISIGPRKTFVDGGIQIYYQDQDIVLIEKPEGLLSVSTAFEKKETAFGILKDHFKPKKVYVVHRLDQDTSGVMLFALSEPAQERLKETFEKHDIERLYIAIVEGIVREKQGSWSSYLVEDPVYRVHSSEDPTQGKLATTHFRLLATSKRYSALELRLETGRKNQIRVHCQDAGHPVVGDHKYGATGTSHGRLCLHAHLIAFKHPITRQQIRCVSPIPDKFRKLVAFDYTL